MTVTSLLIDIMEKLAIVITVFLLLCQHVLCLPQSQRPAFIKYAALGDSYPAGDGAGSSRLLPDLNSWCGRFSQAYPEVVAYNIEHTDGHHHRWNFNDLACGGATSHTVATTQVPHIDDYVNVVTVQVGGNEVDFFAVLNECIQQWHPFSTCEDELAKSRGLIQSTTFLEGFDRMIVRLLEQSDPGRSLIMILGYAKFFNETTSQCDQVTFSKTDPQNFLTKGLRRKFNDLVRMLNEVIRATAAVHGITYLDTDELFEGHRFCEEDVIEPHPDWEGTWFFREAAHQQDSNRDLQLQTGQLRASAAETHLSLPNPFKDFIDLTKTFHPSIEGHAAIASAIVSKIKTFRNGS